MLVETRELVKWTQIDPRNKISMSHFSLGYEKIEKMKKKENDVNDCIRGKLKRIFN